jgi:hypothetical protein
MMKLLKYAATKDTTFVTVRCIGDSACPDHTFAKDAKGWHEKRKDKFTSKLYWEVVDDNFLTGILEECLEEAEANHLSEKKS